MQYYSHMTPQALDHCQVATPKDVVQLMWKMARLKRDSIGSVLDLGAGDGRFSEERGTTRYTGYEIDSSKNPINREKGRKFVNQDVLRCDESTFDLSIGNPPYIKRELLGAKWRDEAISLIFNECAIKPREDANSFIYFLWLSLLRTKSNGLVVQLVPVEWVTRPSAKPLRDYIKSNKWSVEVYRFTDIVFDRVLTTASIAVIDKSRKQPSDWKYFSINRQGIINESATVSDTGDAVLEHQKKGSDAFALRGLSPGGQDIYVLNEEGRCYQGLKVGEDVTRCITSLRYLDSTQMSFSNTLFEKEFVNNGVPCWLIRSDREKISSNLHAYLESVEKKAARYTTNSIRKTKWYSYRIHPTPDLLVASGFRSHGPKIYTNDAEVTALGSVFGVFIKHKKHLNNDTVKALRNFDFASKVVAHSNGLKKIEVRQLNTVLSQLLTENASITPT
jgi:hypothetical protein